MLFQITSPFGKLTVDYAKLLTMLNANQIKFADITQVSDNSETAVVNAKKELKFEGDVVKRDRKDGKGSFYVCYASKSNATVDWSQITQFAK